MKNELMKTAKMVRADARFTIEKLENSLKEVEGKFDEVPEVQKCDLLSKMSKLRGMMEALENRIAMIDREEKCDPFSYSCSAAESAVATAGVDRDGNAVIRVMGAYGNGQGSVLGLNEEAATMLQKQLNELNPEDACKMVDAKGRTYSGKDGSVIVELGGNGGSRATVAMSRAAAKDLCADLLRML